jgi:hypothetical protein
VSHGWLNHSGNHVNLQNVKVSGEAANADTVAAEEFLNLFD